MLVRFTILINLGISIVVIVLLVGIFIFVSCVVLWCSRSRKKGKFKLGERGEAAGAEDVDDDVFKADISQVEPMLKSGIESGIQSDLNLADSTAGDHPGICHQMTHPGDHSGTRNSPNGQSNSTEYYSCRSSSESYNSPNITFSSGGTNQEDVIIWCPKNNTLKRISYDKLLKHEVI